MERGWQLTDWLGNWNGLDHYEGYYLFFLLLLCDIVENWGEGGWCIILLG